MRVFAAKNIMRAAMMLLCGAALAIPAMAQDTPSTPPAQAQQGGGGGGRGRGMDPEARTKALADQLKLSPDQTEKVKAIYTDGVAKQQALQGDPDRRTKMTAIRADQDTKIKAILTDDQKKQYDDIQAQARARMGGGGGGGQ